MKVNDFLIVGVKLNNSMKWLKEWIRNWLEVDRSVNADYSGCENQIYEMAGINQEPSDQQPARK